MTRRVESEGTAPEEKLQEIELHEDNSCCAQCESDQCFQSGGGVTWNVRFIFSQSFPRNLVFLCEVPSIK